MVLQFYSDNMKSKKQLYAIRSDVHARINLSKRQFQEVQSKYAGLFDLGDVEAKYIDINHPLRSNQTKNEDTMQAIIRNSIVNGEQTDIAKKVIKDTLESIEFMNSHLNDNSVFYRGIRGNATESWNKIFEIIASSVQQEKLQDLFSAYNLMKNCSHERVDESIAIYLPWKAPIESVNVTLCKLDQYDPSKIVVLSHDYLTKKSLKPEWRDEIKPMKNEEQVITTLDNLANRDCEVLVYYGHIGFEYEPAKVGFVHKGKKMTAYHTDENGGKLLELRC